ncbi:MAG TPA: RecQ family ATP-dependent DNA helicase, partial [Candidatus Tenderia electrophaga]|nr:RecQ family ATP-dependent DNA helicase [Candidatus Tenderia electrophaga]
MRRNENNTRVFQGKPLVKDMAEAAAKIKTLDLSSRQQERWQAILAALIEQGDKHGFSADELASLAQFASSAGDPARQSETERVIRTLDDMAREGLISKETTLSAYIRYKVVNSSKELLDLICRLEKDFLEILELAAPDEELETPLVIDLRQVNQQLLDQGHGKSSPQALNYLLHGLSRDGKGLAGKQGSISLRVRGSNRYSILLHRDWLTMRKTVQIRQVAAQVAMKVILDAIPPSANKNASLLVEFSLEQVMAGLRRNLNLLPKLKDPLAAAERAITFLHEQKIIILQQGLAVFRQAMTISINPEAKGRRYTQKDYAPLQTHYQERNFQIHVMNEYARRALDKLSAAKGFVASYFNDEKDDFVRRFFPGKEEFLKHATSEQSYLRIVDELKNAKQQAIVSTKADSNMLVLAGPGSGKTRSVAHRVAFLLRVNRIRPQAILVLCFNRSAVFSLRRKMRELVGREMSRVTTLTFHGLALRLTGRSLATAQNRRRNDDIDFRAIIKDAIALLKGQKDVVGLGDGLPRDTLIGRYSHILVDEYQDI